MTDEPAVLLNEAAVLLNEAAVLLNEAAVLLNAPAVLLNALAVLLNALAVPVLCHKQHDGRHACQDDRQQKQPVGHDRSSLSGRMPE